MAVVPVIFPSGSQGIGRTCRSGLPGVINPVRGRFHPRAFLHSGYTGNAGQVPASGFLEGKTSLCRNCQATANKVLAICGGKADYCSSRVFETMYSPRASRVVPTISQRSEPCCSTTPQASMVSPVSACPL